jgi:hypothetical protein
MAIAFENLEAAALALAEALGVPCTQFQAKAAPAKRKKG